VLCLSNDTAKNLTGVVCTQNKTSYCIRHMKFSLLLLFLIQSPLALATKEYAARCKLLMHIHGQKGQFAERLATESNQEVKDYALIIHDDVIKHGAWTEIGAHGKGLSWKWLGVSKEKQDGEDKYKVVGYANPQNYMEPYNRMALGGEIPRIAIGSGFKDEIFIDGNEFGKLPLEVRQNIIKAIRLNLRVKRVRVYQPNEMSELVRTGTLPQVSGSISLVGAGDGEGANEGVNMLSMTEVSAAGANGKGAVPFQIDPTQPVIIGRQSDGIPAYLDPNYASTNIGPAGQKVLGQPNDGQVSRAHFMLEGIVGQGIQVVNGVPSVSGELRAPTNTTSISLAGSPERLMKPNEKVLIPLGSYAIVILPNGSRIRVDAFR
jgi:hypothetical protein